MNFNRRQLGLLALLTLIWGCNWPVMKIGVSGYQPFAFRALCMWLGLPVLALAMVMMRESFYIARSKWVELLWLTATNLFIWQSMMMLALDQLSSGRSAILGYSMPIFTALLSVLFYGERLGPRQILGVLAAGVGVVLLLWHEMTALSGKPWGVLCALTGAAGWAYGIRRMRASQIGISTLTLTFWMIALTAVFLTGLSLVFERRWTWPSNAVWGTLAYNAILATGFASTTQIYLARTLTPLASSLSVMMIPILGVFTGAAWLGEVLHWQDWAAMVLMVLAIGSVLLPTRAVTAAKAA